MNSSLDNDTSWLEEKRSLNIVDITLIILYVTSIIGHTLVILSILLVKKSRKLNNFLIVSLSCGIILLTTFMMSTNVILNMKNGRWEYGETLCKIFSLRNSFLYFSIILHLIFLAIDQYFLITRPITYPPKRNGRLTAIFIIIIWGLSAVATFLLPLIVWQKKNLYRNVCYFSGEPSFRLYLVVGLFIYPLFILLSVYAGIVQVALKKRNIQDQSNRKVDVEQNTITLAENNVEFIEDQTETNRQAVETNRKHFETIIFLGAMIACYLICFLPSNILDIMFALYYYNPIPETIRKLFLCLDKAYFTICALVIMVFKKEFQQWFCCRGNSAGI